MEKHVSCSICGIFWKQHKAFFVSNPHTHTHTHSPVASCHSAWLVSWPAGQSGSGSDDCWPAAGRTHLPPPHSELLSLLFSLFHQMSRIRKRLLWLPKTRLTPSSAPLHHTDVKAAVFFCCRSSWTQQREHSSPSHTEHHSVSDVWDDGLYLCGVFSARWR